MEENLRYIRGRYTFEEKISREGELFLAGKIQIFDNSVYYINIFNQSKYTQDDTLYNKAKQLNNKNVIVSYKDFTKYTINNAVDIVETDEISPKVNIEEYKAVLKSHLKTFKNPSYIAFSNSFLRRVDVQTNFFKAPYSTIGAFSIEGGLLQHTVDKMEIIDSLSGYISNYINVDIEFLKLIALINDAGRLNVFEMKDGVAVKTFEGNFIDENSMTYKMVSETLASGDFKLTESEKFLILHSCINDDTLKNNTSTCKTKESMILTSVKYFSEMINNLLLLKFNNLNNDDFIDLFGKSTYTKNL